MSVSILSGDCRAVLTMLPAESVDCIVTSPPYFGLRDYGVAGQIGLEQTPDAYVKELVGVFAECRRVLKNSGTLWLNLGDSYNNRTKVRETSHQPALNGFVDDNWAERAARGGVRMSLSGIKEKDLIGVPWMVAFALRNDGWYLRSDIIWSKPNPMPESVTDRCTRAHEYLFLLTKSGRYYYDADAIAEPLTRPEEADRATPAKFGGALKHVEAGKQSRLHSGNEYRGTDTGTRNKRSVWTVATQPFPEAHFATFPPDLIEPCIKAGCPVGGTVLDPFGGAGTTGLVADRLQRNAILIEVNPDYAAMARKRVANDAGMFGEVALFDEAAA